MSVPSDTCANSNAIPAGHAYLNLDTFMTTKGKELAEKLLDQAENRNPDLFDMYIHNDYFSYGVFELVDKTLGILSTRVKKKDWKEAYHVLEALTAFIDCEDVWAQCDDGERVRVTRKAIGATALAALQGLEGTADFNKSSFPSLEGLLRKLAKLSQDGEVCSKKYCPLFIGMARRLFTGKTEADFAREREMLKEWARKTEDEDDRKDIEEELGRMAEERNKAVAAGKPVKSWFAEGAVATKIPNELKFARVWKDYREYLLEVPKQPLMGPPKWDLTTWTNDEKKPYHFGELNDDSDDYDQSLVLKSGLKSLI